MNHLHHQFSSAKLLLVSRSGFIPFSISAFQWNEKITTILGLGFLDGKKMHSPNYAVARDWEINVSSSWMCFLGEKNYPVVWGL